MTGTRTQADQDKPKRRAIPTEKPTIWSTLQLCFPWGSAMRPARARAAAMTVHQDRIAGDDLDQGEDRL